MLASRREHVDPAALAAAVGAVGDPELHRPLAELGMVRDIKVGRDQMVRVRVALTTEDCPMRQRLAEDVRSAVSAVPGVRGADVDFTTHTGSVAERQEQVRTTVGPPPA